MSATTKIILTIHNKEFRQYKHREEFRERNQQAQQAEECWWKTYHWERQNETRRRQGKQWTQ